MALIPIKHDWLGTRVEQIVPGLSVRFGQLAYDPNWPNTAEVFVWTGPTQLVSTIEQGDDKFKPLFSCPAGTIVASVGIFSSYKNFVSCNGALLDPSIHAKLFAVIGYKFGSDANGFFKVPNYNGVVLKGANIPTDMGVNGGANTVTLTYKNVPTHVHANMEVAVSTVASHTHDMPNDSYWRGNNSADSHSFIYSTSQGGSGGQADHHWGGTSAPMTSYPQWSYNHTHGVNAEVGHTHGSTFAPYAISLNAYASLTSYTYNVGLQRVAWYDPANAVPNNSTITKTEDWTLSWGNAVPVGVNVVPSAHKVQYYIYSPLGPV